MKIFLKKIFIIIIAFCAFVIGVLFPVDAFIFGHQYKHNYQASVIDKVERLKSIDEPKIILVGNSNLAFGMNSREIQKEIGMPVVNLGLHGGLGNVFSEQISKISINSGDIVILCYHTFSDDDKINDPSLAWITYDANFSFFRMLRPKDYLRILPSFPDYFEKKLFMFLQKNGNENPETCYSRNAFNEYGDVVFKPESEKKDMIRFFQEKNSFLPELNKTCVKRLEKLNKFCNKKGATLVVAGCPVPYGKYDSFTKADIIDFQKQLDDELSFPIISDFTDYLYPYEYFYDTQYHLNEEGTQVRTKQLIKDIKKYFFDTSK